VRCNHDWSPDPLPTVPRPLTRLAYAHFASGPPGGRTLPLSPSRLSDSFGGIYGPHASWASTGANAHRAAVKASSAVARGETEKEVLEYYQYHSDRDTHLYTVRLGRLFYLGSIYFHPGGISSGAEQVGEIPQSFAKAKEYFLRVARTLWPVDFEGGDASKVAGKRKMSKEMEESVREPAMVAAAFLGRMALRGEGGKPDYRRARMWYERAADLVSVRLILKVVVSR
jgi:SEL1 protein